MFYWLVFILIFPYIVFCIPTRVVGKKLLKNTKNKSLIFTGTHTTNNDPIIMKTRVNRKFKIMAKAELFKNKFFGWVLRNLGAYPIKRDTADISAVKTTLKYLKNNQQILIFPEGTRVKNVDSYEFKEGVVTFALKTDCYVVPSAFKNITKTFKFNTLVIGKPFKFSEIDGFKDKKIDKDLIEKANMILVEKIKYLKNVNIKDYKKEIKKYY